MFTLSNRNKFPSIGLGTYSIEEPELVRKCLDVALKAGYRAIDTATLYKNEKEVGDALKDLLPKYNLKREDVFITTKLSTADQGKGKAKEAIKRSLKDLQLSYIDMYLIHWPGALDVDKASPENRRLRTESWSEMVDLYNEGLLKNIGVSNYTIRHLTELLADCKGVRPTLNQVEFHPKYKQVKLREFCKKEGIQVEAYYSLGGTKTSDALIKDETIVRIAEKNKRTPPQVLLKWAIQNGVAVIPKAIVPEWIEGNIQLNFELDDEDMKTLNNMKDEPKMTWDPEEVA